MTPFFPISHEFSQLREQTKAMFPILIWCDAFFSHESVVRVGGYQRAQPLCGIFVRSIFISVIAVHSKTLLFHKTVLPGIKGHNFCVEYLIDLYLSYYIEKVSRNYQFYVTSHWFIWQN